MKWIIHSFTIFFSSWLLLCFLGYVQGSMASLDTSPITRDTFDLLRRQDTSHSISGDSDTAALTSQDGSTGTPPESTSDTPQSPSPEKSTSIDPTTSKIDPPTSSATPTEQKSTADTSPPQPTHQTTPASAISTPGTHTSDHPNHSSSEAQPQNTTPSTHNSPLITPPPTSAPLGSNSVASSFSSPVESAVTSVSPTLVLGDMECASDSHAQPDGRCPANYYCNAALKQCASQLGNDMTCAADFQCSSGYCIGTCANRGTSNSNTMALTGGQIAGITLGTIGGGLLVLVGLLFCYRRRKRRMAAQQSRAMHYMLEGGNGDQTMDMMDKPSSGGTRLSKYNFLAQVLDGHQQQLGSQQRLTQHRGNDNDTHSILDYQNEFYVSNTSLNHHPPVFNTHSVDSSSTTALRPRPITDDFNIGSTLSKTRPDSEAFSLEQRYTATPPRTMMINRDSMTDTVLSPTLPHRFTEQPPQQQQQHFMDVNTLWDDALHQSTPTTNYQHPSPANTASLPLVSQDAWSHEDQASLLSTTTPSASIHGYHIDSIPPPLPSGQPSHRPAF